MTDYRDYLADRAAAYAEVPAPAANPGTRENVPDGMYTAKITACFMGETKAGIPCLKWELDITEGGHVGRRLFRQNLLAIDGNLSYLKGDLASAGMVLVNLTELPEMAAELVGRIVEVKVKTKGQYQNVYIQGLVVPNRPADVSDDDVPW